MGVADLLVLLGVVGRAPEQPRPDGEQDRDRGVHGPGGQLGEQLAEDHRQDHVHRERGGDAGPHRQRASEPGGQDQRGHHRLVRQLGRQDGDEGRQCGGDGRGVGRCRGQDDADRAGHPLYWSRSTCLSTLPAGLRGISVDDLELLGQLLGRRGPGPRRWATISSKVSGSAPSAGCDDRAHRARRRRRRAGRRRRRRATLRMGGEQVLDLLGRHVLALADDHVLDPAR